MDPLPAGIAAIIGLIGIVTITGLENSYTGFTISVGLGYAIVTIGMVIQLGYSHQLAFSQSAFMGAGAYGMALFESKLGWNPSFALLAILVLIGMMSLILGWIVTRTPGMALALATLLIPVILGELVSSSRFLGGFSGIGGIPPLWQGGSYQASLVGSGVIGAIVLAGVVFIALRILRSGTGVQLAALADDEVLAGGMGVGLRQRKLELFVFGSVLAGLGGAIEGSMQGIVTPNVVALPAELTLLIMLFLGGRRSIIFAIIGAVGIEYLSTREAIISSNQLLIEGVLLLAVLLFEPDGLGGLVAGLVRVVSRERTNGFQPTRVAVAEGEVHESGMGVTGVLMRDSTRVNRGVVNDGRKKEPSGEPVEQWSLRCTDVVKKFGGVAAVDKVSLDIPRKGIFGLCGPNGAGKSTLFDVLAGSSQPDSGDVWIGATRVTKRNASERARMGLYRTWQTVRLIEDRTVLDNVAIACVRSYREPLLRAVVGSDLVAARDRASEVLCSLGLESLASQTTGVLTLEGQRMVEVARALAGNPVVLLADEPASGLSGSQREVLSDLLCEVARTRAVLVVEHDIDMLERISERIYAMEEGRLVFEGAPTEFEGSAVYRTLRGLEVARILPIERSRNERDVR